MDVRLILDSGKQRGRETSLARGIYLVGRSRICQIRPKNRYVSRKHCAIIHRKREVLIQDLGSKTGTYVNRVKIDIKVATSLKDGDRIRVGKSKFRIAIISAPSALPSDAQRDHARSDNNLQLSEGIPQLAAVAHDSEILSGDDEVLNEGQGERLGGQLEDAQGEPQPQFIEDVLSMLEDEDDDDDAENEDVSPSRFLPGSVFLLAAKDADADADVEDDSDGNVEFAAPKSSETLGALQPLPSYASRKDWDVQSVYSWINQKETFAKLDERRTKRKAKESSKAPSDELSLIPEVAPEAKEVYTPQERAAQARATASKPPAASQQRTWSDWLDSDTVRPAMLIAVGSAFVAWMAWNVWLLVSFKG